MDYNYKEKIKNGSKMREKDNKKGPLQLPTHRVFCEKLMSYY